MKFIKPLQNGGTQPKWYDSKTDSFFKADDKKSYGGCEGLAETICSDLLDKSNIGLHAHYRPVRIRASLSTFRGCESSNFLEKRCADSIYPFYPDQEVPFRVGRSCFPLTPPEQINGPDREEIQNFLTTIRESMTEEKETEMELER